MAMSKFLGRRETILWRPQLISPNDITEIKILVQIYIYI